MCYSNLLAFIQSATLSGQRNPRASSLSLKLNLLTLPSLKTRQLKERLLYTDIFRAPPRAVRVVMQRKTSVTIILNAPFAKGVSQIIVHCHPQRSTPRYARRYAASNDSPFYSTRFLRLGGRAPTRRERHCHPPRSTPRCARRFTAPNDSHCYSTRFLRLGERAPSISDLQNLQYLQRKKKT